MANVTINSLTPPTITATGHRFFLNSEGLINSGSKNWSGEIPNETKIQIKESKRKITKYQTALFKDKVTISLFTVSDYKRKGYSSPNLKAVSNVNTGDKGGTRNVVIGANPLDVNINKNNNFAEIRYTLNGKDPKHTKNYIYKDRPLQLYNNTSGDSIVLKARVYYNGDWSPVTTVTFRLFSNNISTKNKIKANVLERESNTTETLKITKDI